MKTVHLLIMLALSATAMSSHAEIYKWKDKNGVIRYSDTPPPSNVKQEAIGKKKAVPAATNAVGQPVEAAKPAIAKAGKKESASNEDGAAKKRQEDAEADKKNKLEKEKQETAKVENCKNAKANLENYTQGGRIYKMNEKGEREYVTDAGLEEGKAKAQQDINANCN
jgi:hypothetical protein